LYLESQRKIHRDLSYTNILLRDSGQGSDTADKLKIRQELIESLGLSDIVKHRQRLQCWEGLLIDFDYGASLFDLEDMEIGAGKTAQLEQGLDEEGYENGEDDETVPEDVDQGLQSTEAKVQHPISTFPPQQPSGSRTVCVS
jgi:serine/threonine protein kinase